MMRILVSCLSAVLVVVPSFVSATPVTIVAEPSEFSFPELDGSLTMICLQRKSRGTLMCPTAKGFEMRKSGHFPYTLSEMTGHSWTYPIGKGELWARRFRDERMAERPSHDEIVVSNSLVIAAERKTDTLCWRWRVPVGQMRGLRWWVDGVEGDWVMPKREFKAAQHVALELPKGKSMTFAFEQPTALRIGCDGNAREHASVWFGSLKPQSWQKGERLEWAFRIASDDLVYRVSPGCCIQPSNKSWVPMDYKKEIESGSALDFSVFGLSDAPAGRHGWLKNVNGHFEFENQPGRPVRFYGVNLVGTVNCPDEAMADVLVARFKRLGYNAVRVHHHEKPLLKGSPDGRTFNAEMLDRFDRFMAKLFAAGIYVTTDLYVSREVKWSDLGLENLNGQETPGKCVKPFFETTEAGYENWKRFAFDFLGHVNPYTGRAYRDEPAMPLVALINENALFMNWMEFRKYPAAQSVWEKWLAKRGGAAAGLPALAKDVHEHDAAIGELTRDVETAFFRRATADLRAFGAKALFSDLSAGGGKPILEARKNFDYVDSHFYIDHPIFPGKRFSQPSYIAGGNPVRNPRLAPLALKECQCVEGKPFISSEWSFTGPGMYRGVGGVMSGAAAAANDWAGFWRFAYSHSADNLPDGKGSVGYFDLATDPLAQTADRACICLFLRGDLTAETKDGFRPDSKTGDLVLETPRTCGGFTEKGTVSAGPLTFGAAEPMTVWISSLDGRPIATSGRLMLAHLTDVQSEQTTFGDSSRKILVKWGKGRLFALDGVAEVSLALAQPEKYEVYGLETSGKRRGKVAAEVRDGKLTFACRVKAEDGKARMLYEVVKKGE